MAALHDLTTTNNGSSRSSASFSHTCSGTNRALLVFLEVSNTSQEPTVTAVSYDGTAMTLLGAIHNNYNGSRRISTFAYVLVDPSTGSNTVSVTYGQTELRDVIAAISFTDAGTPVALGSGATGSGTSASATGTTGEDDSLLVGGIAIARGGDSITDGDGTEEWDVSTGSAGFDMTGAGSYEAGGTAGSHTWEVTIATSAAFSVYLVEVPPAAVSGVTIIVGTGDLSLAGQAATIDAPPPAQVVASAIGDLSLSGQTVAVDAPVSALSIVAAIGDLTLSGQAASVSAGSAPTTIAVAVGDLVLSGQAASVDPGVTDVSIVVAVGDLVLSGQTAVIATGDIYWLDSSAVGGNTGLSEANAWTEWDQVDTSLLSAGDIIRIKAGSGYATAITLNNVNGSSGSPIRFIADEPIDWSGGRTVDLPEWESTAAFTDDGVLSRGIYFQTCSYIEFDGASWGGIKMHGFTAEAIRFENAASNITLKFLEIYNNGFATDADGGAGFEWNTDGRGIRISGANNTIEYCKIRDNGQDAIQTRHQSALADLTISKCHFFNSRKHSTVDGASWNYGAHTDGLHVHDFGASGGTVDGIIIEDSIIGPGLTNGVILGDGGKSTNTTNVTVTNTVFLLCTDNFMHCQSGATSSNWTIDNCTFVGHTNVVGGFNAIHANGDCTITDNVFMSLDDIMAIDVSGTLTSSGNVWNSLTGDTIGGTNVDPDFVDDPVDNFEWGYLEPQAGAASGKGSTMYSPYVLYGHSSVLCEVGDLTLTGQQATISGAITPTSITVAVGDVVLSGNTVGVSAGTPPPVSVATAVGDLTLLGNTVAISVGALAPISVATTVGSLVLSGNTVSISPGIPTPISIATAVGTLVLSGNTVAINLPGVYTVPALEAISVYYEVLVGDKNGRIRKELNVRPDQLIYDLDDIGQVTFLMSKTDPDLIEDYLRFGNTILVRLDNGLEDWGGILDDPREWGDSSVKVTAYDARLRFDWRETGWQELYTGKTVADIFSSVFANANDVAPLNIGLGYVWPGEQTFDIEYNSASLRQVFDDIVNNMDAGNWDVTAEKVDGSIVFTTNLYQKKGVFRSNVAFENGHGGNISSVNFRETSRIVNYWKIAGDGDGFAPADRNFVTAINEDSINIHDLRQKSEAVSGVTDINTLQLIADNRLAQTAWPKSLLGLTVSNAAPGAFDKFDIGDTGVCNLFDFGINGSFQGTVRIIGGVYRFGEDTFEIAIEEEI